MLPINATPPPLDPVQRAKFLKEVDSKLLEVKPIPERLPSLKVGEEVTARVVNTLADNRLVVMIKKNLMTLNINARGEKGLTAEPGATMKLKVASLGPRLTFLMSSEVSAEPTNRAMSRVTLSGATRYLSALLNQSQNIGSKPDNRAALLQNVFTTQNTAHSLKDQNLSPFLNQAINRMATLPSAVRNGLETLAHPRTSEQHARLARPWVGQNSLLPTNLNATTQLPTAQQLASSLKSLIGSSGLFYESHLKEWFRGERPLSELLQQPQAKAELPRGVLSLLNSAPTGTVDEGKLAAQLSESARNTIKDVGPSSPQLGQIISKQLDVLEFRQVTLQGQLWPGQPFLMQIQEPPKETDERDAHHSDADMRTWHTRLVFDLPSLGGVEVRLSVGSQGVQLHFMTENPESATLADTHKQRLQQGMMNAGLLLNQFEIEGQIHD